MKKLLLPIAVAAMAVGLATAAPAFADEDSYLADLANNDFTGPTDAALNLGYQVCKNVQHGLSQDAIVKGIYDNTADSVDADDANYIYEAAVIHLC